METLAASEYPAGNGSGRTPQDAFHKLIADLSRALGPTSGLNSDGVDVHELHLLMASYVSDEEEWGILVDEGNGKSNLLVLIWSPGRRSPIHDHADAHCLMKVLKGSLKETRFKLPSKNTTAPPKVTQETLYEAGHTAYMADELGLHKISNPDLENVAVSLHLYTPPNAAKEGCYIYNETTGQKSHVTQSNFYSIYGENVESFQSMK
ncbi:related to cysteine dioxygenase type I [Phialocephala subalpina]|uniref:Cysteine dioxygenase n=1 Tax=Phialocephala subalpina TaxID=576137 RepID=A0A1L7X2L5_9HELO|nr:related to cysteine dioxygenase type I [Phialocephala subalpina]